ncbi:hypothetical protein SAMN05660284_02513 [Formivibrio citricus]|uniref:Uncharacterized protein n=1 Tax=Formivibrio citricus TaxID=83765 RepID=A0A1I5CWB6_9NEIS|nr:hypothetical protein SAMN05660284_02513 [Formivibrio citricus]
MSPDTVRSLTWLAVIMLVVGAMVPAPMAQSFLMGLCAVFCLAPLFWGKGRLRILGALVFVAALTLMLNSYFEAQNELQRYTRKAGPP